MIRSVATYCGGAAFELLDAGVDEVEQRGLARHHGVCEQHMHLYHINLHRDMLHMGFYLVTLSGPHIGLFSFKGKICAIMHYSQMFALNEVIGNFALIFPKMKGTKDPFSLFKKSCLTS